MKLFDTHAHLQFERFESDRDKVVQQSSKKLFAIVNPGADLDSSKNGVDLAQKVGNFYAAVGIHPHHVDHWNESYLTKLENLVQRDKVVAVGEIGLDKHEYTGYPKPNLEHQEKILIEQINLARKYQKPILFHCRKAYDELYLILKEFKPLKGLLHCFMGDINTAEKFIQLGLLISFAGNLTYKSNEHMRQAATNLPEDKILIETDSPYLTPEPHRGERNEPINVVYVAETIASLRQRSLEEVADFTTANARELFGI